ncbi:Uncharacterised protein [Vibrio cholerae]|nr:Uncharacterised protein [Vibrio cholerae]
MGDQFSTLNSTLLLPRNQLPQCLTVWVDV